MFEQAFKNIDDILHKDAGCGSELDYVEQTSWVLFLKYLDDHNALTGDDLKDFVDHKLFPYLKKFKTDALSAETKKLEAIYQKKINDLEELKKSILQKAFSGALKTATEMA